MGSVCFCLQMEDYGSLPFLCSKNGTEERKIQRQCELSLISRSNRACVSELSNKRSPVSKGMFTRVGFNLRIHGQKAEAGTVTGNMWHATYFRSKFCMKIFRCI